MTPRFSSKRAAHARRVLEHIETQLVTCTSCGAERARSDMQRFGGELLCTVGCREAALEDEQREEAAAEAAQEARGVYRGASFEE